MYIIQNVIQLNLIKWTTNGTGQTCIIVHLQGWSGYRGGRVIEGVKSYRGSSHTGGRVIEVVEL